MAGHARRAVVQHLRAHARPQAVGADQRRAFDGLAVRERRDHARPGVAIARYLAARRQLDQRRSVARVEQQPMQVGTVDDAVRILVALAVDIAAHRDARHLVAGDGVAHDQALGQERHGAHGIRESHPVEHLEHVGAELDAGADLAEFRRLLEHVGRPPVGRERQRGSETADAAAGNQHPIRRACVLCHRQVLLAQTAAANDRLRRLIVVCSAPKDRSDVGIWNRRCRPDCTPDHSGTASTPTGILDAAQFVPDRSTCRDRPRRTAGGACAEHDQGRRDRRVLGAVRRLRRSRSRPA